ncbi:SDR family oxidoreductase [Actinomyces radicidentis]|uniref:NAD-dependent dehydratase n=1 Tax=Actinomyces radicidentis TaxID=111015 RepID=A0A0X8JE07_ACTRD|nr:SDR family oxidoreductase [Actinomyces radicidentis]AMD87105.1 NAD-dependent dehydratase [Actinomyces radicidentis]
MSRIVIIGGHGKVALLLAPILRDAGHTVVSLIRDADQAPDIAAVGAEPLVVSVEDATQQDITAALMGADAVVWSAGAGGKGGPDRTDAVDRQAAIRSMAAAADAGVKRYVMVSWAGSYGDKPVPEDNGLYNYAMAKLDADKHLVGTDLDWTIVGPGTLTLDEPSGEIEVTREVGTAGAPTSRANVAQVIAAVLADDATIHRVIPFKDGSTPIAEAVHDVPEEYADLD